MAKELNKILEDSKKGTADERIDVLASIIEDMMQLVLTIPSIFDDIMNQVSEKLSSLESKIQTFEQANKVKADAKKKFLDEIKTSTSTTLTQPKPPPPPPTPKIQEDKKEYKGANTKRMIMDELKELFKKKDELDKKAIEEKEKKKEVE